MDIINSLSLERRLILRSRGFLLAALALAAFAIVFGFVGPYHSARHFENHLTYMREQIRQQAAEVGKADIIIIDDTLVELVKEAFKPLHPGAAPNHIMSMFAKLGPIVIVILGAHIVGSEFAERTVMVRAAHYGWGNCIIVKLMSIVFISAVIAVAGFLIGLVGGRIAWHVVMAGPSEIARYVVAPYIISPHWQQIFLVVVGLSFYGILGVLLTVIIRNSLAGAVIGIAIPYIEQYAVAIWPTLWFLPSNIYSNLLVNTFTYFEGGGVGRPLIFATVEPLWLCWLMLVAGGLILSFSAWQVAKRQAI